MAYNVGYINKDYDHYFTKENIKKTVKYENYALIDSAVSKEDRTEHLANDLFVSLGKLLAKHELPHRQILGSYEHEMSTYSFFVIKPKNLDLQKFRQIIFDLGEKFQQESVIFSSPEKVELVFITGAHAKTAWEGKGFSKDKGKNFSEIQTTDGNSYFIGEYYLDRQVYLKWSA